MGQATRCMMSKQRKLLQASENQRTIQRTMRADYQPFAPFIVWESASK